MTAPHAPASPWRWPLAAAFSAALPAYYIEWIPSAFSRLGEVLYGMAAAILLLALAWQFTLRGRQAPRAGRAPTPALVGVLAALMAVSALLPTSGASGWAHAWRALTALASLGLVAVAWRHLLRPGGLGHLLGLALVVLVLCGAGFWWLEPTTRTLGDGIWLAFTTAATVGYGDVVPTTPASKVFAVFVVLLGYAVLSLVTAAIAASWVETEERRIEREILNDLHAQLGALRAEVERLRTRAEASSVAPPPDAR